MCTHFANTIREVQYEHAPGIATTMRDIGSRGACYLTGTRIRTSGQGTCDAVW